MGNQPTYQRESRGITRIHVFSHDGFVDVVQFSALFFSSTSSDTAAAARAETLETTREEDRDPRPRLVREDHAAVPDQARERHRKKSNQPQNQPPEALHTIATLGFNVESFEFKERIRFIAWEIGGSQSLLWRYYYPNTDFIIYVIDSTDRERLSSSLATLNGVFEDELLPKYPKAPPLLVFANKQDCEGCLTLDEIKDRLIDSCGGGDCAMLKRVWTLRPLVATTSQGTNEGLVWIAAQSSSSPSDLS